MEGTEKEKSFSVQLDLSGELNQTKNTLPVITLHCQAWPAVRTIGLFPEV